MKKHTKIIAILLAGSLLTVGGLQAAGHHGGKQCDGKMMPMMKKLDLTNAQHDAIKAIKDTQHANKMAHKEQMKPIREAMKQQVMSDNFDLREVRNLAHQKALIVESMTVSKAQSMHQVHQQLTPEQRAKMMELKAKMHEKKMKHQDSH
jgi:protein CpxP